MGTISNLAIELGLDRSGIEQGAKRARISLGSFVRDVARSGFDSVASVEMTNNEPMLREDVLRELHRRGILITERTLRLWEAKGITPKPIRRWHEGAVRALYSPDIVATVIDAYRWQKIRKRFGADEIRSVQAATKRRDRIAAIKATIAELQSELALLESEAE
jgi:hypothetical protein